ncbi:acetoacetyl-CoA reductase [Granulosicoccus antarcticus]|uniref:Acetoacetyl-CoA reductase n=1 Tax=Granulosicoccus antarcticus IMCC3135 TaxID=1192854 RepID=A0A2Z2NN08_9GAMM|nr:acetoacetyl-CoA reductase [Granulosicoccus antarcticus]ASJ72609.1 Acetoacetyl-CoA reductase [Granulosicoccus antarcticus IMCC3135]
MSETIVLITGGTGAIGTALCRQFSSEGYKVVANCHPTDVERSTAVIKTLKSEGVNVQLLAFDVTDAAACQTSVTEIEANIGPISVLVNAAGITRDAKLVDLEPAEWSSVLRTNLDGVYNVSRPVITPMIERKYGRIINISSVNGQRGQIGQTNYSAAKAGMTGFTKALAREVARDGITVNSVSPGYVQSPMIQAVPEAVRAKIVKQIPVGRFAEPEEIARAVSFLANTDSGYITGTDLSVNGGYHIG